MKTFRSVAVMVCWLVGDVAWTEDKSALNEEIGPKILVISPLLKEPDGEKNFRELIHREALKIRGVEKIDSVADALVAIKVPGLSRHLALFGGRYRVGQDAAFFVQCTDLVTFEVCEMLVLPIPKMDDMAAIFPEVWKKIQMIQPAQGKLSADTPLVNVRPMKVQLKEDLDLESGGSGYGQVISMFMMNLLLKNKELKVVDRHHSKDLLKVQEIFNLPTGGVYNVNVILSTEIAQLGKTCYMTGSIVDLKSGIVIDRAEADLGSLDGLQKEIQGFAQRFLPGLLESRK